MKEAIHGRVRDTNGRRICLALLIFSLLMIISVPLASADYSIFPQEVTGKIKTYEIIEEKVTIKNNNAVPITGFVAVEGNVSGFITFENESPTIPPGEEGEVVLHFFAKGAEQGTYGGNLIFSGDIQEKVPVKFETYEGEKIMTASVILDVSLLQPVVIRGDSLKYKIGVVNLLSEKSENATLHFHVHRLEENELSNRTIYNNQTNITIDRTYSEVRTIPIDAKADVGDYILRIEMDYADQRSTTDTLFTVRQRFYEQDLFGLVPVWFLSLLLTLFSSGYMSYRVYKKRADSKKRFHVKVEYDELPRDGDRTLFVGNIAETNRRTFFDMDRLTVHSIVAGSTGGGKSISAQDIVEEALLKGVAVAVFDPTAQWSGMLRKLEDKKFLEFYSKFGMDPKKDPRGFNGNIKAVKNGREIIDIFRYLRPGEIQIFTTNTLDPADYDVFVASMIQQIFHSKLDEFRGLKYMLVFDEIHRILPKFGGSGAGFTQIERGCREFRKWGIGIVLISQVLSDFVGEIKANINTLVQMKTRDEGDLERIKMQYGEEYIQSLVKSPVGSGMVQNGAWNRGKPYYVTFRPILHSVVRLTDEELDKYNHYNEIVEQLEFEFDQLEGLKQDVFDLRLELKLSKDKIKSGNFNMVQIYLDGLVPRVQKLWEKLGKSPEKLEIKLLDASSMEAELAKAKAEKEKAEKNAAAQAPAQQQEKKEEVNLTPEQLKEKEDQITELQGQIQTSLERGDKPAAKELFKEIPPIVAKLPDDKKKQWQSKLDGLKKKIG